MPLQPLQTVRLNQAVRLVLCRCVGLEDRYAICTDRQTSHRTESMEICQHPRTWAMVSTALNSHLEVNDAGPPGRTRRSAIVEKGGSWVSRLPRHHRHGVIGQHAHQLALTWRRSQAGARAPRPWPASRLDPPLITSVRSPAANALHELRLRDEAVVPAGTCAHVGIICGRDASDSNQLHYIMQLEFAQPTHEPPFLGKAGRQVRPGGPPQFSSMQFNSLQCNVGIMMLCF